MTFDDQQLNQMIQKKNKHKTGELLLNLRTMQHISFLIFSLSMCICLNGQEINEFLYTRNYTESYIQKPEAIIKSVNGYYYKDESIASYPTELDMYWKFQRIKINTLLDLIYTNHLIPFRPPTYLYKDSTKLRFCSFGSADMGELYKWYDENEEIIKSVEINDDFFIEKFYYKNKIIKQLVFNKDNGFLTFYDLDERVLLNIKFTRDLIQPIRWNKEALYYDYIENETITLVLMN
jgi:hypothetical protein